MLAFFQIPPLLCMNGLPIDLIKLRQVASVLEIVSLGIRQRERPALLVLICPSDNAIQIGFKMNNRFLAIAIGQLSLIMAMDQVKHDRSGAEMEWYALTDPEIGMGF